MRPCSLPLSCLLRCPRLGMHLDTIGSQFVQLPCQVLTLKVLVQAKSLHRRKNQSPSPSQTARRRRHTTTDQSTTTQRSLSTSSKIGLSQTCAVRFRATRSKQNLLPAQVCHTCEPMHMVTFSMGRSRRPSINKPDVLLGHRADFHPSYDVVYQRTQACGEASYLQERCTWQP